MDLGRGLPVLQPLGSAPDLGAESRTPRLPAPQNLSRGLVNVAAKLTHNKDVRDLFVDLVEKVSCPVHPPLIPSLACPWAVPVLAIPLGPQFVEPCRSDHWPLNDVRLFLNQYSASVHSLDGFR